MISFKKLGKNIFPTYRLRKIESKIRSIESNVRSIESKIGTLINQLNNFHIPQKDELSPHYMRQKQAAEQTLEYITKNAPNALLLENRTRIFDYLFYKYLTEPTKKLFLEFGVFKGTTIRYCSEKMPQQHFFGFDSFEGLPEDWSGHGAPTYVFDLKGVLPKVNSNVTLIKGFFNETLPTFLEKHPEDVAFLHIDCDIYSSTQYTLTMLKDRIKPGTVIQFDEYFNYPNWQNHEYKAFQEFIAETGLKYRYIAFGYYQAAVMIE